MSCDDDIKCFLGEHICSQGLRGANVTKPQILNYTNIDQTLCTKNIYQVCNAMRLIIGIKEKDQSSPTKNPESNLSIVFWKISCHNQF